MFRLPMPSSMETLFLPALEPLDARSLPSTLPSGSEAFVPLRPDRRARPAGGSWLRSLAAERPLVGHFCLPDRVLHRLETRDPLGLALAQEVGVQALVTMDVPLYAFMSSAQRDRALALHLHRWLRTVERAPHLGIEPIPIVKALEASQVDEQLDLAQEQGLRRVAFYARELLLERRTAAVRRFVRGAARRGLRPVLLGAASRFVANLAPATLVAQQHYVLARRGRALDRRGRARVPDGGTCTVARRSLVRTDPAALCAHNYHVLAKRLRRPGTVLGG